MNFFTADFVAIPADLVIFGNHDLSRFPSFSVIRALNMMKFRSMVKLPSISHGVIFASIEFAKNPLNVPPGIVYRYSRPLIGNRCRLHGNRSPDFTKKCTDCYL